MLYWGVNFPEYSEMLEISLPNEDRKEEVWN